VELGREAVHGAPTISFLPAVPGSPACRPTESAPYRARLAPSMASSLAKLGFERTRQTYASRAPAAGRCFRPDPEVTRYAQTSRRRRPGPRKSGTVLHQLVTAFGVKKALTVGGSPQLPGNDGAGGLSTGRGGRVMLSAHTRPKCSSQARHWIARAASWENSGTRCYRCLAGS
jgi:hypothetical protein